MEVLSRRHLGKFSKKVSFRSQKLENISLVLYFLENDEHVKIVNIGSALISLSLFLYGIRAMVSDGFCPRIFVLVRIHCMPACITIAIIFGQINNCSKL